MVLASALDRQTVLTAQPPADGRTRDVRVRLEKISGDTAGYLATIQPPLALPAPAAGANTDEPTTALRLLTERGSVGFFDLNLKAGRVLLSPAWKKLLGYAAPELPDTIEAWRKTIHPEDSGAAPDKVGKKVPAGPRPINVEFRMKHRLGHWVWIQCIGLQLVGAPGAVDRVIGLHLDISERKELEEALVANDARLHDLSDAGPLAAFELDFAHENFWFSHAWEKLLGYAEDELPATSASFAAALPPEEASAGVAKWLLNRAPGQSAFVESIRLRAKNGRPVPVIFGVQRSVSRKHELLRVVGFACPLPSGAGHEEGALPVVLANEAFNTLAEGVLITDAHRNIVFANTVAGRLLGAEPLALRGRPIGDFFRLINRQSGRPSDDPVEAALAADKPLPLSNADALAPAIEGQPPTPVVWTARIACGPDGKAQGAVVVFRNPDEMTLTPEELIKANRFDKLAYIAGGITHDINNLLTTIRCAESLAMDHRDYSALVDAEKSWVTLKGLTKQLLAFARGGVGTRIVCTPREILEDSIMIGAAASSAVIHRGYPEGTGNVLVDRAQILQVFQNLIVNALQAMPLAPHQPELGIRTGNLTLTGNQVAGLAAGDYVGFEIKDNGSGIKTEHVEKIFDPFFTTKKHGTGLGLATVHSIVRKHGGQIVLIDTAIGKGTTFAVYLPKAEMPIEVQARPAASLRFGTGRVMFMDDDPKISELTGKMLESLDYKYDLAKNGEEALVLYQRYLNIGRPYDAVIMDLTVIGGMGGEECFEELRKLDPDVRAILASGYDNDDMAQQYLDKGFCGYLPKPYRVTELGKILKTVLG